jgi:ABC-2 type transport system permease protein
MFDRVLSLIRKELQALLRDRQGRMLLIMPVLLQLLLFPFAATLEVKNNTIGILNLDAGAASVELAQRLARAQAFTRFLTLHNETELRRALDSQQALVVLRFPEEFSRELAAGRPVSIQAILDGRRSNSAQIALGYVRQILQTYLAERGSTKTFATELSVRHWYNPNLDFVRHILPSLVAIITTISTLVVTSLSVAREREQGTLDQLLVSPLTPALIMIGKTVPALLVATFQATIILSASVFVYGIPFQGALPLLYGSMFFYILALSGFGLLISSICSTQQQAFLGVFSFLMPAVLLSGFPAPVENMPLWLQRIDWLNPLRHFIVVVKGVFLKDVGLDVVWSNTWPLCLIAVVTLTAAHALFRRRVG